MWYNNSYAMLRLYPRPSTATARKSPRCKSIWLEGKRQCLKSLKRKVSTLL